MPPKPPPALTPKPAPTSGREPNDVGPGLIDTTFEYRDLQVHGGDTTTVSFTVSNTGLRRAGEAPQLFLTGAPDGRCMRQLGAERVELEPGTSRTFDVSRRGTLSQRGYGLPGPGGCGLSARCGVRGGWC